MVKPLVFKGEKSLRKRKTPSSQEDGVTDALKYPDDPTVPFKVEGNNFWVSAEVVSDITGPVLLAGLSAPLKCVSCDANGQVFLSDIENTINGDLALAEPHDVRQVWVAGMVAGTDNISFKGHHGRYLGCNNLGILSALSEAISPEESFLCSTSTVAPGTFTIQTAGAKFLSFEENKRGREIRGDAETVSSNTTFHIRMQARFKPKMIAGKESKAREKVSKKELEEAIGRALDDEEVRRLKKARTNGDYHETLLDSRIKGKHDKYA